MLAHLTPHLTPRLGAAEVGVRLLKLDANATIRPHIGPGGRLVAHLGLRVPSTGAALTVAGETRSWREGELVIFDDGPYLSCIPRAFERENVEFTPGFCIFNRISRK